MQRLFLPLLALLLVVSATRAEDDLAQKINGVIDAPEYKQAHWGILVVNAKTGKTVYEKNSEQLFMPASTTKLFTCAAALAEFGPDFRFETPVYRRGSLKDGILKGDLVLVASGDLSFGGRNGKDDKLLFSNSDHTYANTGTGGSCRIDGNPVLALEELAKQVAKAGVREVRGEILIDDQLFPVARGTGSGPEIITPIMVNDNVLDIVVTAGKKAGEPASVEFSPKTDFYQMDALVTTAEAGHDNRFALQVVGPNQFTIRGEIAVNSKPMERIFPVVEPALFARTLFIEQLRKQGIRVLAPLLRPTRLDLPPRDGSEKLTQVAMFRSAPFSEVVRVTLKVSNNLYASAMPVLIATRHHKLHDRRWFSSRGKIPETPRCPGRDHLSGQRGRRRHGRFDQSCGGRQTVSRDVQALGMGSVRERLTRPGCGWNAGFGGQIG